MELFPLPCPNAGAWVYGEVLHGFASHEPNVFANKSTYREHFLPKRIELIRALIEKHRPAALICTSWTHREQILQLLEDVWEPKLEPSNMKRNAKMGRLHDTVVVVCFHPASRISGPCNAFYYALGQAVAEQMQNSVDFQLLP